ncbi:MAG: hypothetical protein H7Z19_00910, partial [Chitinophagaceae bacterium]|nr:hypothetical protein [Rubrivivax sp.]
QHGATPQALQAYETQRAPAALAVVQRARALGAYMQAQQAGQRSLPRSSRAVMQHTAVDPSLFDLYPPEALAA